MTDDLVQKLRTWKGKALTHVVLKDAADEIERLRAVIRELQMLIAIEADMAVDAAKTDLARKADVWEKAHRGS